MAARWDKGTADYINCPMDRDEYDRFLDALLAAEAAEAKEWEKLDYFEGCLPIEVLARRGRDTLRFGPMKPVGLRDPRTGKTPWAVVQLRKENLRADSYNLVGFQNHLKFGEQARVLRLIPGLENARFLRYGQIHRNTYICAPVLLDETLRLKNEPTASSPGNFPASKATRIHRHRHAGGHLRGGAGARRRAYAPARHRLSARWSTTSPTPTRRTFSPPTSPSTCWSRSKKATRRRIRDKKQRHALVCQRALEELQSWLVLVAGGVHAGPLGWIVHLFPQRRLHALRAALQAVPSGVRGVVRLQPLRAFAPRRKTGACP